MSNLKIIISKECCYNRVSEKSEARFKHLVILIGAFIVLGSYESFGQDKDSLKAITYDDYKTQSKERHKSESLWYRMFHQYDLAPGFSKASIGPSFINSTKSGNVQKRFSLRYKSMHKEISFSQWKADANYDETDTIENHNRITFGYFAPLHFMSIGKRELDIKGFLLQPAFGAGYSRSHKSHGIYIAPAMHFQFPYGLIEARVNVDYLFGKGLDVLPEVSLQLDALRGLLDPNRVKTGVMTHSSTYAEPLGGGWYKVTSTYSENDFTIQDVRPFFGITPRVGIANSAWANKNYKTLGVGLSGRLSFFGLDVHVDKGKSQIGVVGNVNALNGVVKNQFDNDFVQGFVNTKEFTAEANFNLVGLFLTIFKKRAINQMKMTTTPLNRWNFHLGYTYFVPGSVDMVDARGAREYTDKFFADRPDIERNAINDPLMHEAGWGVTYGMSYEMGAVGFRINNKISKTMGSSSTLDVYYIIPIRRVVKAYAGMD